MPTDVYKNVKKTLKHRRCSFKRKVVVLMMFCVSFSVYIFFLFIRTTGIDGFQLKCSKAL